MSYDLSQCLPTLFSAELGEVLRDRTMGCCRDAGFVENVPKKTEGFIGRHHLFRRQRFPCRQLLETAVYFVSMSPNLTSDVLGLLATSPHAQGNALEDVQHLFQVVEVFPRLDGCIIRLLNAC